MEEKNWTVYAHINKTNGKAYVGITSVTVDKRWGKNGHNYFIKNTDGSYQHKKFAPAILKYGWDGFEHVILADSLPKEQACKIEQTLIKKWNSISNGYNVLPGGEINRSGIKASEETREKLSKALSGENNPMYGHRFTEEERKKLSDIRKGKKHSEETRQKIAASHIGKKHSADTLKKMHDVRRDKKSVRCVDTSVIYASCREAERMTGVDHSQISAVCRKKARYKTAGGYTWEFV